MPFMSFGLFLKQQRETNGWTIKELADRLGFSSSYISQLENGTRVPSQKQLAILAKAYRVSDEELSKRWAEAKIQKVSMSTNYKFDIKEVGEKRVHEAASRMEQGLEELKKTFFAKNVIRKLLQKFIIKYFALKNVRMNIIQRIKRKGQHGQQSRSDQRLNEE